jgi:hypothetical protein
MPAAKLAFSTPSEQAGDSDVHVPSPSQVDTLVSPAMQMQDDLEVVENGFLWLGDIVKDKLDTLRRHLKAEDEPSWESELLEGALSLALSAGAAAGGVIVAEAIVGVHALEQQKELVKTLFEDGVAEGVSAGRSAIFAKKDLAIDAFIDSQKVGVASAVHARQTSFVRTTRHQVTTPAAAAALAGGFAEARLTQAADAQYAACRDAWVSYLAQDTLGAGESNTDGTRTTNMTTTAQRTRVNRVAPNFVPSKGPEPVGVFGGGTPGVLFVCAVLPDINPVGMQMNGKPTVVASLNGVNGTVRQQYVGRAVADMHIPRQVIGLVGSWYASFTLNLDEEGNTGFMTPEQAGWLRARAVAEDANNATLDPLSQRMLGLELLLRELVPTSVDGEE